MEGMKVLKRSLLLMIFLIGSGLFAGCTPATTTITVESGQWSGWTQEPIDPYDPVSATLKHGEWMTVPGFGGKDVIIHVEHIGGAFVDIRTSEPLVEVIDGAWGDDGAEFTLFYGETKEFATPTLDAGVEYRITANLT